MTKDKKVYKIKEINKKTLDTAYEAVVRDKTYGEELKLVTEVLTKYPQNNDINIVAMKIALIDVTNSTHLHQYKEDINLGELARFIVNIKDFDKKVATGDTSLVKIIAKNNGNKNLFSFASKYCHYHNSIIYKRDDYSKFDGIVSECLPFYFDKYGIKLNNKKIVKNTLNNLRKNYDYDTFNNLINSILENFNTTNKKAKFDYVMWYYNRKPKKS